MVQYISTIPDIEQVQLKDHPIGDSFLLDSNIYIKTSNIRMKKWQEIIIPIIHVCVYLLEKMLEC